jgi:hypothetical protein
MGVIYGFRNQCQDAQGFPHPHFIGKNSTPGLFSRSSRSKASNRVAIPGWDQRVNSSQGTLRIVPFVAFDISWLPERECWRNRANFSLGHKIQRFFLVSFQDRQQYACLISRTNTHFNKRVVTRRSPSTLCKPVPLLRVEYTSAMVF